MTEAPNWLRFRTRMGLRAWRCLQVLFMWFEERIIVVDAAISAIVYRALL